MQAAARASFAIWQISLASGAIRIRMSALDGGLGLVTRRRLPLVKRRFFFWCLQRLARPSPSFLPRTSRAAPCSQYPTLVWRCMGFSTGRLPGSLREHAKTAAPGVLVQRYISRYQCWYGDILEDIGKCVWETTTSTAMCC